MFSYVVATPWDLTEQNMPSMIHQNRVLALKEVNQDFRSVKLPDPLLYKPLVVSGPSGVGKGTLLDKLTEKYNNKFGFSVSYCTRAARPGEEHGVHYFFITKEAFKAMIDQDAFIEHCEVHGNFYGTSK